MQLIKKVLRNINVNLNALINQTNFSHKKPRQKKDKKLKNYQQVKNSPLPTLILDLIYPSEFYVSVGTKSVKD